MLLRKTNHEELKKRRKLKPLTLFNLVECFGELKEQGYFYDNERVESISGPCLTMGKERELLCLSKEWNVEQIREKGITAIKIVFCHVITREVKYLIIMEEMFEDEVQTIMWMDDEFGSVCPGSGRVTLINDMPIVFEEILHRCEMILVPGKFYKLDFQQFRETMGDSLFAQLYQKGFIQVQEGRIEIKEGKEWERSFAWGGAFRSEYWNRELWRYMEIAIYYRWFEERELGDDDRTHRIWEEEITDVYVAWSQEKLSEAGPADEIKIPLKALKAEEEIAEYLRHYHDLDQVLTLNNR